MNVNSEYLNLLKDRINLRQIPFSERGSRLLIFRSNGYLTFRLAERWFKREGQLSAYRKRPPLIDQWVFTDEQGNPLEIQVTTYPHRIDFETRLGTFSLAFVDIETVMITLPPAHCTIKFNANLDKIQTDRRGGILRITGDIRRSVAYTTNARIVSHATSPLGTENQSVHLHMDASDGGKALLLNITPRLGFNRYIPKIDTVMDAAEQRWHQWFASAPQVEEEYRAQYYYAWWIMRAGLISTRFYTTREAMTPSMIHYVGVWQWDAFFQALAYRHVEKHLAQDQIRIVLDHQREDGMIPDAIHDEGTVTRLNFPVDADVTKPPLIAWAAYKLYEMDGDHEFLDEIYEPIVRWNNWWFEQNDMDGNGLCEYQHPFSSGLDDSPLWDEGMPVEAPDLNTYLYLQQESLAKIASVLGNDDDAALWRGRAEAMARRLMEIAWDKESGFFWARRNGSRVNVRTPFNLFPLITGQMPSEITDRLVTHLTDERQFWTRYPVATVAMDDPTYTPGKMWRGPTWVNVNYLLIEGLQRSGYADLARELRRRTLDLINSHDDIYEYYDPVSGENPPSAASMFGWSSAVFIDLAIEAAREKSQ
ncbi:MAG TPA: trehalase family glycosidase [Anaerolineales bacterium]|nr:trehalase family glycosidase [Anaerolineales bacterium]